MRDCLLLFLFSYLIGLFAGNGVSCFSMKTNAAQFTTIVPHKGKECFFTDSLKTGNILTLTYVPISKESDHIEDSSVSIEVYDFYGGYVPREPLKENPNSYTDDHDHKFNIRIDGEYKICLINVDSWSDLYVYFEMYVKNPLPKEANDENDFDDYESITDEERKEMKDYDIKHEQEYQMKVSDIRFAIVNILEYVERISFYQSVTQAHYTRDHNIAINLGHKISFYSIFVIVTLFGVGFIQVVMVKSLFDEKKIFHRFIK